MCCQDLFEVTKLVNIRKWHLVDFFRRILYDICMFPCVLVCAYVCVCVLAYFADDYLYIIHKYVVLYTRYVNILFDLCVDDVK